MVVSFSRWSGPYAIYLFAGSLSYIIALLITGAFNVPLNNKLAVVKPDSSEGAHVWNKFVPKWMIWNHVRTMACVAASASLTIAFGLFIG